jgi:amidase
VTAQFRKLFADNLLDAIIMPVAHATAAPHDKYGIPAYTVLANVIDFPAATLPFSHANAEKDAPYLRENVTY